MQLGYNSRLMSVIDEGLLTEGSHAQTVVVRMLVGMLFHADRAGTDYTECVAADWPSGPWC